VEYNEICLLSMCRRENGTSIHPVLFRRSKKELEKLVKLNKSKPRDKILTYAEFVLPVQCEAKIVYTVPISHSNQGVTMYLFVLRKQRTKDDGVLQKKAKAAHLFNDNEDDSDESCDSDNNSVTVTIFV
jgi:hypothetical protein